MVQLYKAVRHVPHFGCTRIDQLEYSGASISRYIVDSAVPENMSHARCLWRSKDPALDGAWSCSDGLQLPWSADRHTLNHRLK